MKRLGFFTLGFVLFLSAASQIAMAAAVRGQLLRLAPNGQHSPAPGVAVTTYAPKLGRSAPAYSDPSGMFYLTVPAGAYTLEVWTSRDPHDPPKSFQITVVEPYTDVAPITIDLPSEHIQPPAGSTHVELETPTIIHLPGFGNPVLREIQPVGLVSLPSGLTIADQMGRLILLETASEVRKLVSVGSNSPVIAATLQVDGKEVILAVTNNPGLPRPGRVWMYRTSSDPSPAFWSDPFDTYLAGCALDETHNTLYVVDRRNQLFKLSFKSGLVSGSAMSLFGLDSHDTNLLLAVDSVNNRLFAVAQSSGNLYQVDLSNGHAKNLQVKGSLGSPAAIAVQAGGQRLYSVDGTRVRVIQLDSNPPLAKVLLRDQLLFDSLSAVAVGADGRIWIGDKARHAVYVISPGGQVAGVLAAH